MNKIVEKTVCFATALLDAYKEDERKELNALPPLELPEDDMTEDFTAMLYALYVVYNRMTGNKLDIFEFVIVLMRLAIQDVIKAKEDGEQNG